ncbi:hypothetical protein [Myxococcus stipitatus]|uniref:hypothetical protein n=1 Tax=Myxococcus stipitatus TaxID=83455 RepID=UPI0030D419E4
MHPSGEAAWPESLRPLYEGVASTPDAEAVAASVQWAESFAQWVRGASLEERNLAQLAAWARLAQGERGLAELMFLVGSCGELLWPYAVAPSGLLERLLSRQAAMLSALRAVGEMEVATRLLRETEAGVSAVVTRYVKRHPDSLGALVGRVPCTFNGSVLRFMESVEVDLKRVMASGAKAIGMLEQLRALLPATAEGGRDKLAEFIRSRASRIPWQEASEILAERLFSLATAPEGRGGMRGFLACYPNGRKEPEWCERAGVLLARTLEVGGSPAVVENLCELLGRFDAPPVDGLRGALGALVGSEFEASSDLGPARFVVDHCLATLRKGEPGLVLTLVWLEERLFRASVRKGLTDAFERRKRIRTKLEPLAPAFAQLCWLAEECAELWPRLKADARPGMDELAAWRDEVAERVGRKPMLRKAAIEFFLWCAPDAASSEAELTVLSLVRTETDRRQVRKLKDHPSSRVRLRVRTLQRWFQGAGKEGAPVAPTGAVAPASITEALRHLHVTRAVPMGGRTWLKDRDLEELALGAVARVEADFSARYPERFREDTVELVGTLLEGLREEMGRVKADLFTLLAQGQPPPLDFELTIRRGRGGEPEAEQASPEGEVQAADQGDLFGAAAVAEAGEVVSAEDVPVADGHLGEGDDALSASEPESGGEGAGARWGFEPGASLPAEAVVDAPQADESSPGGDAWVRLDMGFSSVTSIDEVPTDDTASDAAASSSTDDALDPNSPSGVRDDAARGVPDVSLGFSGVALSDEPSVSSDAGTPSDVGIPAVLGNSTEPDLERGEVSAPVDASSHSMSERSTERNPGGGQPFTSSDAAEVMPRSGDESSPTNLASSTEIPPEHIEGQPHLSALATGPAADVVPHDAESTTPAAADGGLPSSTERIEGPPQALALADEPIGDVFASGTEATVSASDDDRLPTQAFALADGPVGDVIASGTEATVSASDDDRPPTQAFALADGPVGDVFASGTEATVSASDDDRPPTQAFALADGPVSDVFASGTEATISASTDERLPPQGLALAAGPVSDVIASGTEATASASADEHLPPQALAVADGPVGDVIVSGTEATVSASADDRLPTGTKGSDEQPQLLAPVDASASSDVPRDAAEVLPTAASVDAVHPTAPESAVQDDGEVLPPLLAPTSTSGADARLPDEAPLESVSTPALPRNKRGKGRGSRRRGSAHSVTGTEVAFILEANVDGFVHTERVSLVHVVKLEQRGEGQWLPHFRIGREHIDTMLSRTDSAFCLFLVPPVPRAECWLLPARLVRELMETQRSLTTVPRDAVARAARSLSQWWLGDFASLWTGDTRASLLAHVSSHAPDAPDFVVRWSLHSGERPGRT